MTPDDMRSLPTESMVAQFEREHQIRLPDEYRRFVLNFDGVNARPLRFRSKYGREDQRVFLVRTMLPLADRAAAGFENLQTFMETYQKRGRVPRHTIPIASDPFGNLFLLTVQGPEVGRVSFWDHELEPDEDSDDDDTMSLAFPNVRPVADSFGELLELLRPFDESE